MKIVLLALNDRCNLSVSDADMSSDVEPYLDRQTIIPSHGNLQVLTLNMSSDSAVQSLS